MTALHGGLGWDHMSLRPWLDPLAEHARLTYVDLLGCGQSPAPEDWSSVTHATWANGVEATRRQLDAEHGGHERVILFGHSYGAVIALEVAHRHPETVAGLILCASPSRAAHLGIAVERAQRREVAPSTRHALDTVLAAPPATDAELAALMPDLLPLYVHQPDAHDLAAYATAIRFRAAPCRRSFYELFADTDLRPQFAGITAPTLVLSGRHDWLCPPDEGPAEITNGLANAEHHVFEHSGHLPFLEEPEAFLEVVGHWLEAHTSAHRTAA